MYAFFSLYCSLLIKGFKFYFDTTAKILVLKCVERVPKPYSTLGKLGSVRITSCAPLALPLDAATFVQAHGSDGLPR